MDLMREGFETAVNNLSEAFFNLSRVIAEASGELGSPESKKEFSFAPAKSMRDAVELAKGKAEYWMEKGSNHILDVDTLGFVADKNDKRCPIDQDDCNQFYLVSEDGSIGLTLDGCANIEWLYEMTFME